MGIYLGNGLYKDNNNKIWKLALRLNKNDYQFYYNNSIWTNNLLLNETIFDLSNISNSKYSAFNNIKTTKILIQMNNKDVISTLNDTYKNKTLYELFTTINPTNSINTTAPNNTIENYIGQTTSPWGFSRSGIIEPYTESNISFNIICNDSSIGIVTKCRLGLGLNDVTNFGYNSNGCGSVEGIGLYSYSGGYNYYNNSGYCYWKTANTFVPCNLYVECPYKFLIKDGDFEEITDGNMLNTLSSKDTYSNLQQYGMNYLGNINSSIISLINNNKYNIDLFK